MNDEELRLIVASGRNLNITKSFLEDVKRLIELMKSPVDVISEILPDFKRANPVEKNVEFSKEGCGRVIIIDDQPGIVVRVEFEVGAP